VLMALSSHCRMRLNVHPYRAYMLCTFHCLQYKTNKNCSYISTPYTRICLWHPPTHALCRLAPPLLYSYDDKSTKAAAKAAMLM